jgi:NTP pyrophosphatase (non-canonical NTP hydrolase)
VPDSVADITARLRRFADERDWHRYHTARNLSTAIAGEAGELAAVLQWTAPEDGVTPYRAALDDEIADVLIYLIRLCDVLDLDLLGVANAKIERNAQRFPPHSTGQAPPR